MHINENEHVRKILNTSGRETEAWQTENKID